MADPSYQVFPGWKDVVVYAEGDGRELRLDAEIAESPYQVNVPTADRWVTVMPPWAHDRRAIILDRLRAADCVIAEKGDWITSIFSPDGTFRVEIYWEPDDRAPPQRSIRIVANDDNAVVAHLYDGGINGSIRFPSPGMLTLPFESQGRTFHIGVNIPAKTYWLHPARDPAEEARPIALLASALIPEMSSKFSSRPTRPPSATGSIAQLLACFTFVAAGIWQVIDGHAVKDHWLGAVCVLFFGACAIVPVNELRGRARARK